MKTLYLDIDGVLNTFENNGRFGKDGYSETFAPLFNHGRNKDPRYNIPIEFATHLVNFEVDRCYALLRLIKLYKIEQIILCTSWRIIYSVEDIKIFFYAKGFPEIADLIKGECPYTNQSGPITDRDQDILTHIKENNIEDYYILDDEVFNIEIFEKQRLLFVVFEDMLVSIQQHLKTMVEFRITTIEDYKDFIDKNTRYETILKMFKERRKDACENGKLGDETNKDN